VSGSTIGVLETTVVARLQSKEITSLTAYAHYYISIVSKELLMVRRITIQSIWQRDRNLI